MDWKEQYKDKIYTPEEAVKFIQSGDCVMCGCWMGEPGPLVEALCDRGHELHDVNIVQGISPSDGRILGDEFEGHFRLVSTFFDATARRIYKEGRADYIGGSTYHVWPKMFAENELINPHWAMIMVGEPDENGDCSYGQACDFTEPEVRTAAPGKIMAQINPNYPNVGGTKINIKDIDVIVPAESPLWTIGRADTSDPDFQKIANFVCERIKDGSTIQLGIGQLPDIIALGLADHKHLGVHTETLTQAYMDLVKCGAIDNSRKTLDPGVCIGSQAAGSLEFYEFLHNNPMFENRPVDYTNDPYIIGQNFQQVSINACLQVDLKGQVASETVGGRQYSGIGGQLDHVRGAQLTPGGQSFLCMKSTAKGGTLNKIKPFFEPGTVVTVGRYDVDKVVTEYGVAELKYKSEKQRAEALIAIAHPDFRDELRFEGKKLGVLY